MGRRILKLESQSSKWTWSTLATLRMNSKCHAVNVSMSSWEKMGFTLTSIPDRLSYWIVTQTYLPIPFTNKTFGSCVDIACETIRYKQLIKHIPFNRNKKSLLWTVDSGPTITEIVVPSASYCILYIWKILEANFRDFTKF